MESSNTKKINTMSIKKGDNLRNALSLLDVNQTDMSEPRLEDESDRLLMLNTLKRNNLYNERLYNNAYNDYQDQRTAKKNSLDVLSQNYGRQLGLRQISRPDLYKSQPRAEHDHGQSMDSRTYMSFSVNSDKNKLIETYKSETMKKKISNSYRSQDPDLNNHSQLTRSLITVTDKEKSLNTSRLLSKHQPKSKMIEILYENAFNGSNNNNEDSYMPKSHKLDFSEKHNHIKNTLASLDKVMESLERENVDYDVFSGWMTDCKKRRLLAKQLNPVKERISEYLKSKLN